MLGTLATVSMKVLMSMASRLITSEALEWVFLWAAEKLVAATDTPHDDEFLAKVKELLKKEPKSAEPQG